MTMRLASINLLSLSARAFGNRETETENGVRRDDPARDPGDRLRAEKANDILRAEERRQVLRRVASRSGEIARRATIRVPARAILSLPAWARRSRPRPSVARPRGSFISASLPTTFSPSFEDCPPEYTTPSNYGINY